MKDRARFFDIARGSAFECAAILDVLVASDGLDAALSPAMKRELKRIVSMLTRMTMKFNGVAESQAEYNAMDDYEHEHEGKPEQNVGPDGE